VPDPEARIAKALAIASEAGMFDGGHHKMWVIDQMVRALTGCPVGLKAGTDVNGTSYQYEVQGESPEYQEFLALGEWSEGVIP
jgi:hypothetical protein